MSNCSYTDKIYYFKNDLILFNITSHSENYDLNVANGFLSKCIKVLTKFGTTVKLAYNEQLENKGSL